MATHVIKASGVSEELLRGLDERVRRRGARGRSDHIRELIRRDLATPSGRDATTSGTSFREILAPVHDATERFGFTDEEIDLDIDDAIREYRGRQRRGRPSDRQVPPACSSA